MSGSTMPDDVRARISQLFPTEAPSPEQLRAASLAGRERRTRVAAHVLAGIAARSPELGDYARWIVATGARQGAEPVDRPTTERELWTTVAALRVLSYRRETTRLATYLADNPTDELARRRVADLVAAVRDIERRFPGASQRAQLELAREASAPGRRAPLPNPPDEERR